MATTLITIGALLFGTALGAAVTAAIIRKKYIENRNDQQQQKNPLSDVSVKLRELTNNMDDLKKQIKEQDVLSPFAEQLNELYQQLYEYQERSESRKSDVPASPAPVQKHYPDQQMQTDQQVQQPEQIHQPPQQIQQPDPFPTMEEVFKQVEALRNSNPQYFTYNKSVGRFDAIADASAPYILAPDYKMLPNEIKNFRSNRLQDEPYECKEKIIRPAHRMIRYCEVDQSGRIIVVGKIAE